VRTRAKVAEEIAALAAEVSELVHARGVGLPDVRTVVDFIVAAFEYDQVHQVAEAVDARGYGALGEEMDKLQIAPAADELRACVGAAFQAIGDGDLGAFTRASAPLRQALLTLLEARAGKWPHLWEARELYPPSWQKATDPLEYVRARVPKLTRWEALVWAGQALRCAEEDVWLWRFWQTGQREHLEVSLQRGQAGVTERDWEREVAQHTLPEEEARVVDSWPVPPDEEWPKAFRETSLPNLRKWQADRAAREEPAAASAEDASAQ